MPDKDLKRILRAWRRSRIEHFGSPATEEELQGFESELGRQLPESLRQLYQITNGASVLNGNFQTLPLNGPFPDVRTLGADMRNNGLAVPEDLLIFADDGSDLQIGIWLPPCQNPRFQNPIVAVGRIYDEPGCMGVFGTGLIPFLLGWTAYYLTLCDHRDALDILEVPAELRFEDDQLDDDAFMYIRQWADPDLQQLYSDPYDSRLDEHALRELLK